MGCIGRVMDDHEAFLYLHHGSCGCCVYVYITQDGKVLQFDGEKQWHCKPRRLASDYMPRKDTIDTETRESEGSDESEK